MIHIYTNGIHAEWLKVKRSLVLLVALAIPIFPAGLNFGQTLQRGVRAMPGDPLEMSAWTQYLRSSIDFWVIFALPMIVAILGALLANVDHKTRAWKVVCALPYPRAGVFTGKWVVLMGLTGLSALSFGVVNQVSGIIVHLLRPELGLGWHIPWAEAFLRPLLGWLLAAGMVTIQHWISIRWPNFLVSILTGFSVTVMNLFIIGSFMVSYAGYLPWSLPSLAYDPAWPQALATSAGFSLVAFTLALAEFKRRDIQ